MSRIREKWRECLAGSLAGLCAFLYPATSNARECPTNNQQIILDAPFDIRYGSWIEQSGGAFVYSRCVAVTNGQSANVDWIGSQLKGIAKPGSPQYVTFPFLLERTEERDSELRYGVEPHPERGKRVKILANVDEAGNFAELQAYIEMRKMQGIQGETLPADVRTATSKALINFYDSDRSDVVIEFASDFRSDLDLGRDYTYALNYTLRASKASDGTPIAVPEGLSLRLRASALLTALVQSKFDGGLVPLRGGENSINFSLQSGNSNPRERRTTQAVSQVDVVRNDEVLASFPISFFSPSGFGP